MIHLSLASHPFLGDHRIEERPVLPLAWALDALAADQRPPFALVDVKVERGLILFDGEADVEVRRDDRVRLVEIRPTGRVVPGFSARLGAPGRPPSPPDQGAPRDIPLPLDEFYATRAYHGPRMQALTRVQELTDTLVRATVRTSVPRHWQPDDPRSAWSLDPLAIDGLFQLALYWAAVQNGPRLVPKTIAEVALAAPFDAGELEAVVWRAEDPLSCNGVLSLGDRPVAWIRKASGLAISGP